MPNHGSEMCCNFEFDYRESLRRVSSKLRSVLPRVPSENDVCDAAAHVYSREHGHMSVDICMDMCGGRMGCRLHHCRLAVLVGGMLT